MVFLDQIGTAGRELAAPPVARTPLKPDGTPMGQDGFARAFEAGLGDGEVVDAVLSGTGQDTPDQPKLPETVLPEPGSEETPELVLPDLADEGAEPTVMNDDPATMAAELIAAVMGSEAAAKSMEATASRIPAGRSPITEPQGASPRASLVGVMPEAAAPAQKADAALDPVAELNGEKAVSAQTAPVSKADAMMAQVSNAAEALRPTLDAPAQQNTPAVAATGAAVTPQSTPQVAQAPLAPPPPPIVNTAQAAWVEQVVDRIKTGASDGVDEIEMLLSPRNLGKVAIRIDMKDGVASVAIVAETPEAARLFNDTQARLSDLMGEAGLNLASHDAGTGAGNPEHGAALAASGPSDPEPEDNLQTAAAPQGPAHAGLIDTLA